MHDAVTAAMEAAREAGRLLADRLGGMLSVERKADRSLVTELDREAERIIVDRLTASFPGYGVLAEERGRMDGDGEWTWVVDPLDGTHNYVRGIRCYGVSIALARGGELAAGVIYMPSDDEMYAAERGGGAFKNGAPIRVSPREKIGECSVGLDSDIRHDTAAKLSALGRVGPGVFNVRMFGSSARTLSYVAEGRLDASVEFLDKPWDFAAGACLVREAGGAVSGFHGQPLALADSAYIASNGNVHDALCALVRGG